mmetsp:Transcript_17080/g.30535  ORF Transcript_17080/g.30535 Transcript_17080/m.30535 type:complete len:388 (-) Transcript_17080:133-1296(-)
MDTQQLPASSTAATRPKPEGLRGFCRSALKSCVKVTMLTLRCVTCSKFSRESHAEALFKHDPQAGDSAGKTQGALLFEAANQNMMAYMRKKEVVVDEKRDHQVGGHVGAFKDLGDKIHKLVMDQPELVFYKKINQAREEGNDALAWPTKFSASFHGTVAGDEGKEYMVLENLMHGYTCPCVMDLKIGTRTADADAAMFKSLKMQARDEISGAAEMGVQLIAMSVYRPKETAYYKMSKMNGYIMTATIPLEQILGFFMSDGARLRNSLVSAFRGKVEGLLHAFKENRTFEFIGSSLLFTYEGQPEKGSHVACDMRMIDFGHAVQTQGARERGDPFYQTGLESILRALDKLQHADHLNATGVAHMRAAATAKRWKTKAAAKGSMSPTTV